MGLIKTCSDDDSKPGKLGVVIPAAAAVAAAHPIGKMLGRAAVRDLQELADSGALHGNLTDAEADLLEKKMGRKGIRVQHATDPLTSHYSPLDIFDYHETGDFKHRFDPIVKQWWRKKFRPEIEEKYDALADLVKDPESVEKNKDAISKAGKDLKAAMRAAPEQIVGDRNSYVYAHELGHASGPANASRELGKARRMFGMGYAGLSGLAKPLNKFHLTGLAAAARQANKEQTGEDSSTLAALDNTGRALSGLQLFEEGQATARGLKGLYGVQGMRGLKGGLRALAPAYLTYAASPLANHVLAPLAVKGGFAAKRKFYDKPKEEAEDADS